MKNIDKTFNQNRRLFLAGIIPACSAFCLSSGNIRNLERFIIGEIQTQEEKHKFLKDYRTLSLYDYWSLRYREFIRLVDNLSEEFGKDRIIELIKKETYENMFQYGKNQAKDVQKNHFKSYRNIFRGPVFDQTLTMEVVEDTDTVFEIKVTECIGASVFHHYNAGDIGYAKICWGDYGWAKGYHMNILLTRDKTLMEGHKCCNHRYTWIG